MPDYPDYEAALARVLALSYPPTTLRVPPSRAGGHRLARPVIAKGNQPLRPIALVDGLAVIPEDVLAPRPAREPERPPGIPPEQGPDHARIPAAPPEDEQPLSEQAAALSEPLALIRLDDSTAAPPPQLEAPERAPAAEPAPPAAPESPPAEQEPSAAEAEAEYAADAWEEALPAGDEPEREADEGAAPPASGLGNVLLELRPIPATSRREDSLQPGQAIAIPAGAEVPRGAGMVYPLAWIAGPPGAEAPPERARPERAPGEEQNGSEENHAEEDELPLSEPPRIWDLPARYAQGNVELPRLAGRPPRHMIGVGDWARNRENLLPERAVIRAGEMALLEALEIDEVEVYRRPVVGVASLGWPFPHPQHGPADELDRRPCPLMILAAEMSRAAEIAALPLGYAPKRFRPLLTQVQRWVEQVDILLLVGGPSHGPLSLGRDLLATAGKLELSGTALHPCESFCAGTIGEHPVLVMPGSLPQVLAGFVLFGRPLLHKYLTPGNFSPTLELELEYGSRIRFDHTCAVPVRYGLNPERGVHTSRFSGRLHDAWLDYIKGQALVLFEGGRQYADGEKVTAYVY